VWCEAGLNVHDHTAVAAWCKTNDISLVVIGPEDLLAEGLTDSMIDAGNCFTDTQSINESINQSVGLGQYFQLQGNNFQ